jgi:NAD(P)-dependent dehydrogenase (short-subunit alcohol dehydrogenase family)
VTGGAAAAAAPGVLTGAVAVVTGAARGIGRAIALDLARAGADVGLGLRDADRDGGLAAQIAALGRRALPVAMDVTDLTASRAALDRVAAELGGVDVLVNNAGGSIRADALDVTEEDFAAVWELNVRSTFFLSQHAARLMRDRGGGAIVNVASQAGLVALPGEPSYCVAKAAVVHLTRCLAVEWGPLGIRVNAVAPTFIETDGTAPVLGDEAFRAATVERIAALHRIGTPHEVSPAVVFLASPAASMVTGHTLVVDGGWTLT